MTALRVKPFCPCDANRPQDCNPEQWSGAHAPSTCAECGQPNYTHGSTRQDTPEGPVFVAKCRAVPPREAGQE